MKVLHIINNLGSGGAEKLIEEALPLMNNIEGIEADILLLNDKDNVFDKKLKKNKVKVDVIPLRRIYSPFNIYYIIDYIIKGNYDVVHAHLFPTVYWTSIASKLLLKNKPKFIMTEHSTYNRRREKNIYRYLEKFIYSSYEKIISISNNTQENLVLWLKPKQKSMKKFMVIENGINVRRFKEAEPYNKEVINSNFTEDTKLICMIGRFSKQKDQSTLIKAIKNLPKDVHLLLIGEGDLKKQNENLVKELKIENKVHFLGFRSDVERIIKTSDIVVLSSNWEGFGLVAVEGMASGKPVIASDVPGLREVVSGAGILFHKGDSNDLSDKIKNLFENQKEYYEISKKCFERSKKYDINAMVRKYCEQYLNNIDLT